MKKTIHRADERRASTKEKPSVLLGGVGTARKRIAATKSAEATNIATSQAMRVVVHQGLNVEGARRRLTAPNGRTMVFSSISVGTIS